MSSVEPRLSKSDIAALLLPLKEAVEKHGQWYPGDAACRQPVHTIYGGAQLYKSSTITRLGELASASLDAYAPDILSFWEAFALPGYQSLPKDREHRLQFIDHVTKVPPSPAQSELWLVHAIYNRVKAKLRVEPVEDFRIDFEDGFGYREDAEEDEAAIEGARSFAKAHEAGALAPFMGIRVKALTPTLAPRSLRTLDLFLTTLVQTLKGPPPERFLITLPKIEYREQIKVFCQALEQIEQRLQIPQQKIELMIETTQSMFTPDGRVVLRPFLDEAGGRVFGAHFGTYDYTAACDVVASEQRMDNPVCDFARHHMKVALARTGVFLSDGATNVMPVGPYESKDPTSSRLNLEHVHAAWRLSFGHIQRSLEGGIYQGWDLHPAQVPVRYAAIYHFFLKSIDDATSRLRNFLEGAAKATLSGNVFDDAATGQGLLNFFIRAYECRAITEEEFTKTGLSMADLKTRSFPMILKRLR